MDQEDHRGMGLENRLSMDQVDRLYSEEELPPEFKLFLPIQKDAAGAAPPVGP